MPSLIDDIPAEELVAWPGEKETAKWQKELWAYLKNAAREFLAVNDPAEWRWLALYLDPDGPAFSNSTKAAQLAFTSKSIPSGSFCKDGVWRADVYHYAIGQRMVLKHQDRIRAWLADCGYTAEAIKLKTRKMFNARKTHFFQKDGEVVSERVTEDNQAILKALDLASKHLGMMASEKVDLGKLTIEVVNYLDRKENSDPS